ncbi:ExbD/TolR family protein [Acidimangrovimonas sediminis]|uniref:ExbD/TolR family protein n=1 Tax=Acidimangrovimonas sediminis TaxID=2056283 RepID=UPI0018EA5B15|nr:biopolymer transporter ExbD [Acidimangrovimonas sediminis]
MDFGAPRRPRRPNLTPMIDVVFLLLVFFMLASRFANDTTIPLATATAAGGEAAAPLRLVEVAAGGALTLNGAPVTQEGLPAALGAIDKDSDAPVVLRGRGAGLQALVSVMDALRAAGFRKLVLVK